MQTLEAINMRHSTRDFSDKAVSADQIDKLLAAANAAPVGSAKYENIHLTVITKPELLALIGSAAKPGSDAIYGAPLFILVSAKPDPNVVNIEFANAACILENLMLAATDLGLQSVYIWGVVQRALIPNKPEIVEQFELPEGFVPVSGVAIGYAAKSEGDVHHKGYATDFIA